MTTGRSLRMGEAAFGGLLLFLGLFIAFETTQLSAGPGYAAIGPALFPYMIATGLVLIGVLVLREAFFGHIAHERGMELDWWSVALVIAGLVIQGVLLLPLGWIIATAALFVVVARAFGAAARCSTPGSAWFCPPARSSSSITGLASICRAA